MAETGSGGFVGYSACLTWDGVEIRGFDGVKRYCKELGIQLPKKNSIMPQIEVRHPMKPFRKLQSAFKILFSMQ